MAVAVNELEGGRVVEITLSGKLVREDYDRFVPEVNRLVGTYHKIGMIVRLIEFHGWTAGAFWEDVKFDLKHFNHINRLAVVGETWWHKGMAQFCRPFTTAKIRYFDTADVAEARTWVLEGAAVPEPVG
jgi:hypothetical protein